MTEQYRKAYKELYVILQNCSKEDIEKIPKDVLENIELKMDKDYEYKMNDENDIEKQEMSRETLALLAIYYRDYWATEEEKQKIIEYQKKQKELLEQEKSEKYSYENIFKNSKKSYDADENITNETNNLEDETITETNLTVIKKDNFIQKIWKKIKMFFKF